MGSILLDGHRFRYSDSGENGLPSPIDLPEVLCCFREREEEGLASLVEGNWKFATYRELLDQSKALDILTPSPQHIMRLGDISSFRPGTKLASERLPPPKKGGDEEGIEKLRERLNLLGFTILLFDTSGGKFEKMKIGVCHEKERILVMEIIPILFKEEWPTNLLGPWFRESEG